MVSYKVLILRISISFFSLLILNYSCKKNDSETCNSTADKGFSFEILESVLDTILPTDTAFSQTLIAFKAGENVYQYHWAIGNDGRAFNNTVVNLVFEDPVSLNVTLTGSYSDQCFFKKGDITKPLTILANDGSHISPLAGFYQGYNTDKPQDTFSINIQFWIGDRYNWWPNGAYSIQNLPKGYFDDSKEINGSRRPEISGIICSNGYKHLAIDKTGDVTASGIKGYASLKQGNPDTLIIQYTIIDMNEFNLNGKIKYIDKQYVGFKK